MLYCKSSMREIKKIVDRLPRIAPAIDPRLISYLRRVVAMEDDMRIAGVADPEGDASVQYSHRA